MIPSAIPIIEALPLTYETFLPYGNVIQGYSTPTAAPKGIAKTPANQGTAAKYHRMAPLFDDYPKGQSKTSIRTVRAGAQAKTNSAFDIKILERHPHSTQTFIPMGKSSGPMEGSIEDEQASYIVIAALSGKDGQPDLDTLRAFLVPTHQAVSYNLGVWHHPLLTLNKTVDYAVIEANAVKTGRVETELWTPSTPVGRLLIPELPAKPKTKQRHLVSSSQELRVGALSSFSSLAQNLIPSGSPGHIKCLPLTASSFARFGNVIQAYDTQADAPKGIEVEVNQEYKLATAYALAPVESTYQEEWGAKTAVSLFRSTPKEGMQKGKPWPVHFMER